MWFTCLVKQKYGESNIEFPEEISRFYTNFYLNPKRFSPTLRLEVFKVSFISGFAENPEGYSGTIDPPTIPPAKS